MTQKLVKVHKTFYDGQQYIEISEFVTPEEAIVGLFAPENGITIFSYKIDWGDISSFTWDDFNKGG